MPQKLSYLMIYQKSGLPIYSKCYTGFCMMSAKDPILLTGFLSALENFSEEISKENLDSISMGNTVMNFKKSLPTGHSVVIGIESDKEVDSKLVEDIFNAINHVLETKFLDTDWDYVTTEKTASFEKYLLESALVPALHAHGGFQDECPKGDMCPMKILAGTNGKQTIWKRLRNKYETIWDQMKKKMN